MLCNSGWSWMFKARSMKKIRQREMLSDQFFTVGDLRWLTCCRTVGDHDPGMPNFLTKVRESDAERVRRPSELNLQHIEEHALSDMAFFKPFMYSRSFHIFSSFSGMHWELPEKKNWITQMMRPTRPFEKKEKQTNRINNWNPPRFFQELVELLEYVVDGGTEVFRWPLNRRDFDANMEADGKCCNC